eukprot:187595-Rhodomonas_salina.1
MSEEIVGMVRVNEREILEMRRRFIAMSNEELRIARGTVQQRHDRAKRMMQEWKEQSTEPGLRLMAELEDYSAQEVRALAAEYAARKLQW